MPEKRTRPKTKQGYKDRKVFAKLARKDFARVLRNFLKAAEGTGLKALCRRLP